MKHYDMLYQAHGWILLSNKRLLYWTRLARWSTERFKCKCIGNPADRRIGVLNQSAALDMSPSTGNSVWMW